MKRLISLLVLVFLIDSFNSSFAQFDNRQRLLTDVNWKFSQPGARGADKTEFKDSRWLILNLPHDWGIQNEFVQMR